MPEEKRRRRRSKRHQISFLRHFRFEIFTAFIFFLGAFLLFEDMEIKAVVFSGLLSFVNSVNNAFSSFVGAILGGLSVIETSDVVGTLLIIIALLLLVYRARQKAIERYSELSSCPECGSDLVHVHRNQVQRVIGTIFRLKIRRYQCKECSFDGVRVRSLHTR